MKQVSPAARQHLEIGRMYRVPLEADESLPSQWGTLDAPTPQQGGKLYHLFATENVILRHARYRPGTRIGWHRHAVPVLVYGDGGPCYERHNGRSRSKARLNYHPAGYEHELVYGGHTDVLAVELAGDIGKLPTQSVTLPATAYGCIWETMAAAAHADTAGVDSHIRQVIALANQQVQSGEPEWLRLVRSRIHDSWDKGPSARALAAAAKVSVPHLSREFRRWTGVSMRRYAQFLRLDRARHMIWSTDLPLSRVAAETGFTDESHLSRALQGRSGFAPGQLRKVRPTRLSSYADGSDPIDFVPSGDRQTKR